MKYKVEKIKQAEHEFNNLTSEQQQLLNSDYDIIENFGLERVSTKKIETDIYEIRTSNLRSLYTYQENKIIVVVTIFIKTTNKTPEWAKKVARKRIKNLQQGD